MNNKKTFLVDCSAAGTCCDKSQYKEASAIEKVKLLIHLVLCRNCRKYSYKNTRLTKLIEKSKIQTCTEEEKKQWQTKIEKELTEK